MTPDSSRDDDTVVSDLLREAGMSDDAELTSILSAMRASVPEERPTPSAEVRELLGGAPRRRVSRFGGPRRGIVTALVVTVMLAGGVSAAAASPDLRGATHNAINLLAHAILPSAGSGPRPAHSGTPSGTDHGPIGIPVPGNGASEKTGTPEAVRKPASPAASSRPTSPSRHTSGAPDHPTPPSTPGSRSAHSPEPGVPKR